MTTERVTIALDAEVEEYEKRLRRAQRSLDEFKRGTGSDPDLSDLDDQLRALLPVIEQMAEKVRSAADTKAFDELVVETQALAEGLAVVGQRAAQIDPGQTEALTAALARATVEAGETFSRLEDTEGAQEGARRYGRALADVSDKLVDIVEKGARSQSELSEMGDVRLSGLRRELGRVEQGLDRIEHEQGFKGQELAARDLARGVRELLPGLRSAESELDHVEEGLEGVEAAAKRAEEALEGLQEQAGQGVQLPTPEPSPATPSASPSPSPGPGAPKGPKLSNEGEVVGQVQDQINKTRQSLAVLRESLNSGDLVAAGSALGAIGKQLGAIAAAAGVAAVVRVLVDTLVAAGKAAAEAQERFARLEFQADDARQAAGDYAFLRESVSRLNGDVGEGADLWLEFRRRTNEAGVDIGQQRLLFEAMTTAAVASGKQLKDAGEPLSVVADLYRKARLEASDLSTISGALGITQERLAELLRAESVQALRQMADAGELLTSRVLPQLGNALLAELGAKADQVADSNVAAAARFRRAWEDSLVALGSNKGFITLAESSALGFQRFLKTIEEWSLSEGLVAAWGRASSEVLEDFTNQQLQARGRTLGTVQAIGEMIDQGDKLRESGKGSERVLIGVQAALGAVTREGTGTPEVLNIIAETLDLVGKSADNTAPLEAYEAQLRSLRSEAGQLPEVSAALEKLRESRDRLDSGGTSAGEGLRAVSSALDALGDSLAVTPEQLSAVRAALDEFSSRGSDQEAGRILELQARLEALARRAQRFSEDVNPVFQGLQQWAKETLVVRDAFAQLDDEAPPEKVTAVREAVEELARKMQEAGARIPEDLSRIGAAVGAALTDVDRLVSELRKKPLEAVEGISILRAAVDRLPPALRQNASVAAELRPRIEELTEAWVRQGGTLRTLPSDLQTLRQEFGLVSPLLADLRSQYQQLETDTLNLSVAIAEAATSGERNRAVLAGLGDAAESIRERWQAAGVGVPEDVKKIEAALGSLNASLDILDQGNQRAADFQARVMDLAGSLNAVLSQPRSGADPFFLQAAQEEVESLAGIIDALGVEAPPQFLAIAEAVEEFARQLGIAKGATEDLAGLRQELAGLESQPLLSVDEINRLNQLRSDLGGEGVDIPVRVRGDGPTLREQFAANTGRDGGGVPLTLPFSLEQQGPPLQDQLTQGGPLAVPVTFQPTGQDLLAIATADLEGQGPLSGQDQAQLDALRQASEGAAEGVGELTDGHDALQESQRLTSDLVAEGNRRIREFGEATIAVGDALERGADTSRIYNSEIRLGREVTAEEAAQRERSLEILRRQQERTQANTEAARALTDATRAGAEATQRGADATQAGAAAAGEYRDAAERAKGALDEQAAAAERAGAAGQEGAKRAGEGARTLEERLRKLETLLGEGQVKAWEQATKAATKASKAMLAEMDGLIAKCQQLDACIAAVGADS